MAPNAKRTPEAVLARLRTRLTYDDNGCWLWTGGKNRGYGRTTDGYLADGRQRRVGVHRLMYELLVGPIPDGLQIDHLCRVPACCNPAHLEPVTARENTMRSSAPSALRAAQTECIYGHAFTSENTYVFERGGYRQCRECRRRRSRERYERDPQRRTPGVCIDCGGATSNRANPRCRSCYLIEHSASMRAAKAIEEVLSDGAI